MLEVPEWFTNLLWGLLGTLAFNVLQGIFSNWLTWESWHRRRKGWLLSSAERKYRRSREKEKLVRKNLWRLRGFRRNQTARLLAATELLFGGVVLLAFLMAFAGLGFLVNGVPERRIAAFVIYFSALLGLWFLTSAATRFGIWTTNSKRLTEREGQLTMQLRTTMTRRKKLQGKWRDARNLIVKTNA